MVATIRQLHGRGLSYRKLAEIHYCSISTIRDVVKKYGAYRRDFDV